MVVHDKEKILIPELIFGHLLTGSNFDDSTGRLTGGRHGYGAKLTNILSSEFTVETLDHERGKLFRQTWRSNMAEALPPEVDDVKRGKAGYTRVRFKPDLDRLGSPNGSFNDDDIAALRRRVWDVSACLGPDVDVRVPLLAKAHALWPLEVVAVVVPFIVVRSIGVHMYTTAVLLLATGSPRASPCPATFSCPWSLAPASKHSVALSSSLRVLPRPCACPCLLQGSSRARLPPPCRRSNVMAGVPERISGRSSRPEELHGPVSRCPPRAGGGRRGR